MMKKQVLFIETILICLLYVFQSFAGHWEQNGSTWKYKNDDGSYLTNTWHQDPDQLWYYFGSDGTMLSNQWVEGKYYLGKTGAMLVNTITPDGYRVGADGAWIPGSETSSNSYENSYEESVLWQRDLPGYGDIYCDFEINYNNELKDENGTVIALVNGVGLNKNKDPYLYYQFVSTAHDIISVPVCGSFSTISGDEWEISTFYTKLRSDQTSARIAQSFRLAHGDAGCEKITLNIGFPRN